jgi:hypothetical protein
VVEREQLLTRTFVELADNLVEFDVVDVLTTLATRTVAPASTPRPSSSETSRSSCTSWPPQEAYRCSGLFDPQGEVAPPPNATDPARQAADQLAAAVPWRRSASPSVARFRDDGPRDAAS